MQVLGQERGQRNRFPRVEHLRLQREITAIFSKGKKCVCYPYRAVFRLTPAGEDGPAGVAVALVVQKRVCKRAVDRNAQRRRMREYYRLHIHSLRAQAQESGLRLAFVVLCISKEKIPYVRGERAFCNLLKDMNRALDRHVKANQNLPQ